MEKYLVDRKAFVLQHADRAFHAGILQNADALACDLRIGIQTADDHARELMLQNRLSAGRGASPVTARLQGDINRRALGRFGQACERIALRVQTADLLVPALTDDAPVLDDNRADHRIRRNVSGSAHRELQRTAHILLICHGNHLQKRKMLCGNQSSEHM